MLSERTSRTLLVKPTSMAVALILLAVLSPLRWASTLLAAEQPVVDPKELPKFPAVAAPDAPKTFQP